MFDLRGVYSALYCQHSLVIRDKLLVIYDCVCRRITFLNANLFAMIVTIND